MERGNLVSVCLGQRRNGVRTERDVEVDNVSVLCKTAMLHDQLPRNETRGQDWNAPRGR